MLAFRRRKAEARPLEDLVVIIPGIMGSRLERNGELVWDLSPTGFWRALRGLKSLKVGADRLSSVDGGDVEQIIGASPATGITPAGLIDTLQLIPGLMSIDGYDGLFSFISSPKNFNRSGDNVKTFAYDWRLSCAYNAAELKSFVDAELDRWRSQCGNPAARVVFVCHSMGGLVARYYCEALGGARSTRELIGFGTPHRGALKALSVLASGKLGPLPVRALARSLPSIYELLPTYPCVEIDGTMKRVSELRLDAFGFEEADLELAASATEFHRRIRAGVAARITRDDPDEQYGITAMVGRFQPTYQTADVQRGALRPRRVSVTSAGTRDRRGDGTVPSFAALPFEWTNDRLAIIAPDRHNGLQHSEFLHHQLRTLLTPDENIAELRGEDDWPAPIGLDTRELVEAGEAIEIDLFTATDVPAPQIEFTCTHLESGAIIDARDLRASGGSYPAITLLGQPSGTYRIDVQPQGAAKLDDGAVGPPLVSEVVTVW